VRARRSSSRGNRKRRHPFDRLRASSERSHGWFRAVMQSKDAEAVV
jgi:hypothetical protein